MTDSPALEDKRILIVDDDDADATSVIAAKKAGIPAYIVKPIFPQELKTKVSFLLAKSA